MRKNGVIFGGVLVLGAFTLIITKLGIFSIPWTFIFAAVLVILGLILIVKGDSMKGCIFIDGNFIHSFNEEVVEEDGVLRVITSFKETVKRVESKNLSRADVDCSFGEVKLSFADADFESDEIYVGVDVKFGSLQLFIPKNWTVVDNTNHFACSVNEKNPSFNKTEKILCLTGSVKFSGIEINYI